MHFQPSQRIRSRLQATCNQSTVAQTQLIPIYVPPTRKRRHRQYLRCDFRGFYEPETVLQQRYVWTGAQAKIECHFPLLTAVRYLWLDIVHIAPHGSDLQVRVNGVTLSGVHHLTRPGTLALAFEETQRVTRLEIVLESTTFIPRDVLSGNTDTRVLGIALGQIVLAKRRSAHEGLLGGVRSLPHLLPQWLQHWWTSLPRRAA